MAKRAKRKTGNRATLSSLAKSVALLRSEVTIGNREVQAGLSQVRQAITTGFDQLYRHVDGFMKLHETLDIEMKVLNEQMKRLEERVKRLEAN